MADIAMANEAITSASREEDLLETAIQEHSRLVYRIAFSVLRNHSDAEDATQDAFLRVLRYGKKFGGIENPKAWLARIAWRTAVERRDKSHKASPDEEASEQLASPAAGAEQGLLNQERSALLERLIAALPDQLRDPLLLSTLQELSPREAGLALGISEATVRSRAFRARQILKGRLLAVLDPRK